MFVESQPCSFNSKQALKGLFCSIIMTAGLAIADGFARANAPHVEPAAYVFGIWIYNFRMLFEQLMYVFAILFVGLKFLETRTVFSVGFDTKDAARMSVKGPDESNIVWVGRRYDSVVEAETVADTMQRKLKETA